MDGATIELTHLILVAIVGCAIYFGARAARTSITGRKLAAAEHQAREATDKLLNLHADMDEAILQKNNALRKARLASNMKEQILRTRADIVKARAMAKVKIANDLRNGAVLMTNKVKEHVDDIETFAKGFIDEIKAERVQDREMLKGLLADSRVESVDARNKAMDLAINAVDKAGSAVSAVAGASGDASVNINNFANGEEMNEEE